MKIRQFEFSINANSVAPCIYGTLPHETTGMGMTLESEVGNELRFFLQSYNEFLTLNRKSRDLQYSDSRLKNYYRVDCYHTEEKLSILEINACFVDGWGTSLNLSRAAGIDVEASKLVFPERFGYEDSIYLPELKLFADELKTRSVSNPVISDDWIKSYSDDASKMLFNDWYVYGKQPNYNHHIYPLNKPTFDGTTKLDNKINLALFGNEWSGKHITIPKHYIQRFQEWEEIPETAVLKFLDKTGPESAAARQSVLIGKPSGKAKFLKECYRNETLLAQEYVKPSRYGDMNSQLVIMCIDNDPITGYVQYSDKKIINDNSVHGPLQIN